MQQRSFLTRFIRDHLDKLDLSTLFAEYRAADKTRIASPGPLVYAPDFATRQRPFLRLSFGVESRLAAAAERLHQAFSETFAS